MIDLRRRLLRSVLFLAGGSLLTFLYSWKIEPRWVHVEERPLPIANLPPSLDGEMLVQLSDLHVGKNFDARYQIEQMSRIEKRKPAFVVYTGDYVTYESAAQIDTLRNLLVHAPHGRLGTAAILGNHDYGFGWQQAPVAERVAATLRESGIPVLRNESVRYAGLRLAGIDEVWGTNYDPEAVTGHLEPDEATVVLCHNPDIVDEPVWNGYRGWILAGHTHGGQVRLPLLPPPYVPVRNRRYTSGEFDLADGRRLYINRGLGNRVPFRFNVRPEITLFTLRRAA